MLLMAQILEGGIFYCIEEKMLKDIFLKEGLIKTLESLVKGKVVVGGG